MIDKNGRTIEYLRLSVTDRCNLRCKYCMPECGIKNTGHEEILSFEETVKLVKIMQTLGIKRVRFTGGEPLVRKGIETLIQKVTDLGVESCLTTNGILLEDRLDLLLESGLTQVSISLDTLNRKRYQEITGMDGLPTVWKAVEASLRKGLAVRINSVLYEGCNEDEICALAALAKEQAIDVRFIELMPIGEGRQYRGISNDIVLKKLEQCYGKSTPEKRIEKGTGPARYVTFEGFCGRIGLISPFSHTFCASCNRVRLTADGYLKLCLSHDAGVDLKRMLREGQTEEEITKVIRDAIWDKPTQHTFTAETNNLNDRMVQIGG